MTGVIPAAGKQLWLAEVRRLRGRQLPPFSGYAQGVSARRRAEGRKRAGKLAGRVECKRNERCSLWWMGRGGRIVGDVSKEIKEKRRRGGRGRRNGSIAIGERGSQRVVERSRQTRNRQQTRRGNLLRPLSNLIRRAVLPWLRRCWLRKEGNRKQNSISADLYLRLCRWEMGAHIQGKAFRSRLFQYFEATFARDYLLTLPSSRAFFHAMGHWIRTKYARRHDASASFIISRFTFTVGIVFTDEIRVICLRDGMK